VCKSSFCGNRIQQYIQITLLVLLLVFVISGCQTPSADMLNSTPMQADVSPSPTNTLIPEPSIASPAVEAYTDFVEYTGKFHIQQILSVRLPEETTPPYPTILMFHSGGFSTGEKEDLDGVAEDLSRRGFAAVNVNYHLHPYPAPLNDAFCALTWVYAEAQTYQFDTHRVIALGVDSG
jgi:acetyl esterase/lipase